MILTMISLSCTVNEQSILEMSKAIHDGMTLLLKMKIAVTIGDSHKPPQTLHGYRPGLMC